VTSAIVVLALLAGALGAVLRAATVAALPRIGTALVNVAGTVVLAVCVALAGAGRLDAAVAAVAGLGFAGSLTTFSGWVARVDEGLASEPARTVAVEVLLPLALGVAVTVATFVAVG
jgi:fluoride ion exporter CrcB/FEX